MIDRAHLRSREQVFTSNAGELADAQRTEHFALDPRPCPEQMDGKLIVVMWLRDGRRILFWLQDFRDVSNESKPEDSSG